MIASPFTAVLSGLSLMTVVLSEAGTGWAAVTSTAPRRGPATRSNGGACAASSAAATVKSRIISMVTIKTGDDIASLERAGDRARAQASDATR